MATRNNKKLAALNNENCEEHPRSILAQNSNVPRSQEDYITPVSEEIVGRVTKKLSQDFSRRENGILGAFARLDDFLTNPLIQGLSGTGPETSRNIFTINQGEMALTGINFFHKLKMIGLVKTASGQKLKTGWRSESALKFDYCP